MLYRFPMPTTPRFKPLQIKSSHSFSPVKRRWWNAAVDWKFNSGAVSIPRAGVLQSVMWNTPRPTNKNERIGFGCYVNMKLHDREPEFLVEQILNQDPEFFTSYPRRRNSEVQPKSIISEFVHFVYNLGEARYGKPRLTKQQDR